MMGGLNGKAGAVAPAPAHESAGVVIPTANPYPGSGGAANAKAACQPRRWRPVCDGRRSPPKGGLI